MANDKITIENSLEFFNDDIDNVDFANSVTISQCNSVYLTTEEINPFLSCQSNHSNYMHINCRSLPKNYECIINLMSCINTSFSVIAVSETWLKPHNEYIYDIPGYTFVSCTRNDKVGGGVELFVDSRQNFISII